MSRRFVRNVLTGKLRKVQPSDAHYTPNIVLSYEEKQRLKETAQINSRTRFQGESFKRKQLSDVLLANRLRDKNAKWGFSFDSSLELVSEFYGLDLAEEIKNDMKRKKDFTLMSLGCGTGRSESELFNALGGKAKIIATGLRKLNSWKTWPNSDKISWSVMHAERFSKRIKPSSIDFIHSSIALYKTPNLRVALNECLRVLKKGGRLLFSEDYYLNREVQKELIQHPLLIDPQKPPFGFRFVRPPWRVRLNLDIPATYGVVTRSYYLEKL